MAGSDKNNNQNRVTRPRIADVAKAAGVSQTTVSFVLNNRAEEMGISQETADRVRATMAEMEYQPSRHARALSTGRSRLLGVIPYKSRNLYRTFMGQRILEGFATVTFSQGYHFVIFEELAPLTPDREINLRKAVVTNEIDGLVVLTVDYPDEDLKEPLARLAGDVPLLTIGTSDEPVSKLRLSIHLEDACQQVLQHFTHLGHEKIGLAFHPDTEGTMPIIEAFQDACEDRGSPLPEDFMFTIERNTSDLTKVVAQIREAGVTALFCVFDLIAMKLTFAFQKAGLSIPNDVSLVGFGDYLTTPHIDPPLTTFAPPMHSIGEMSANYLIGRVENPSLLDQPVCQRLRGELVIRASTAPPGGFSK
jgi:DNA-binding LacI/PurR family transcriptional regulator